MSSVGIIEALIALRMQLSKINTPFCTICYVTLPSSSQRCPLIPETSAANERMHGRLLCYSGIAVNCCFLKLEMAERFLEASKGCHRPSAK